MNLKLNSGIDKIKQAKKPIGLAWEMSIEYLDLDRKLLKVVEILSDHENLFVSRNPYHNHYHTAEVIWAASYMAKKENIGEKKFDSIILLLLAATFHDAEHPGRTNKLPFEIELNSKDFFSAWWRNNSLFVENITSLSPIQVEQIVGDIIIFTDFVQGHPKVTNDYPNKKEYEIFGVKINKLKKILNEADFLLNCLPQYGLEKTEKIIKESGRLIPETRYFEMLLAMLKSNAIGNFNSDAAKDLKIESLLKKFILFLEENKHLHEKPRELQLQIEEKFKSSI